MFTVGMAELFAGCLIATGFLRNLKAPVVVWFFCAGFVVYRVMLWTSDSPMACPCLGRLVEYSSFLQHHGETLLKAFSISGLVLAGCQFLCWRYAGPKNPNS